MRSTRRFASLLVAAIFAAMVPGVAGAAPPFQERISDPVSFVLPAGEFCDDFDVQVDVEQKFKFIAFSGHRGTWISAITVGKLKVVLTNLDSEESVALSIPGPGFIDVEENLILGTGPWLIFIPGEILLVTGHITFTGTPPQVEPVEIRGNSVDLCDVLA
jgi:hypothetical protein